MSKDRQILDYLNDILDSIVDIKEFVMGMSYENFIEDKKTIKAVIRSLRLSVRQQIKFLQMLGKVIQKYHGKK